MWRAIHPGTARASSKISPDGSLHQLHDEIKSEFLHAWTAGIRQDCQGARAYFAHSAKHE